VWYLSTSHLPGTPFALERDSDGQLVRVKTNRTTKASVSFNTAKIDAKNSLSSASSTHHFSNSAFPCRRVTIINYSDHPLLRHIGEMLPDHLSSLSFIDHVNYFPANTSPPVGSRSADLWITLDLGQIETSGMLPRFTLEATIVATVGSTLAGGSYNRVDATTPPTVGFNWNATIDHKSTTRGSVRIGLR